MVNQNWTLRAGLAYDEQAGEATLSIPDSDRCGIQRRFDLHNTENMTVDAAFALVQSKSGSFTETDAARTKT